jgi:acetyl-CoA carboxylase biotin carboxyl carrier protein
MRDVIQVERAEGTPAGDLAELARVADELLPPLVARLSVSDLGEIEVRQGTWRVRIRRTTGPVEAAAPAHASGGAPTPHVPGGPVTAGGSAPPHPPAASAHPDHPAATSTAVGYFGVRSGLAVGHRVARGDVIGWVDVLGVRQEIVSPADGVVGRFLTEPGDPVEYGQELVSLMAATGPGTAADGPADAGAPGPGSAAGPA